MANKIWQTNKSNQLHPLIESYTVGIDYILDQELLGYDIKASKAHANMLHSIEIINDEEIAKLIKSLDKLYDEWLSGKFTIKKEYEDGHTAIETYLTEQLGDIGKKIHTARSRNDQALVMMRLYMKDKLSKASESIDEVITALQAAAEKASNIPMPGYTHMQKAMPTTVASWLNSYADAFTDTKTIINSTLMTIDQNPLGSAAGFGVDININREHTTKALGFNKTQQNPLYCGLSRGLFELIAIQSLNPVITLAGKFANDMMLFTTEEYNFFSLPESFTTGSSIMPHKHNYDLFEIIRGQAHAFIGYIVQIQTIYCGTGSGYHRDLQLTKKYTLEAFDTCQTTIEVLALTINNIQINKDVLAESITTEMQSVAQINKLVNQGVPFRDAYNQIKDNLNKSEKI